MKPEIIITARGHAATMATLQAEFTAHLLHEASEKNAFFGQHADKVRALATFGPMAVDGKVMDLLPKLEIIANFGVGVDAIKLEDAKTRGIIVTNTPDVLNETVADTALALILNTVRRFPQSEQYLRGGNWAARGAYALTTDIGGKTLGVLGLGRIKDYARRAQEEICVLVQVETQSALDSIEAICGIDGVDGVFIGPADLHASLGYAGEIANPKVMPVIDDAIRRIRKAAKAPGILTPSEGDARRWLECGALFVAVGADVGILARGAEALAAKFKRS